MITKFHCPQCNKPTELLYTKKLSETHSLHRYKCGHTSILKPEKVSIVSDKPLVTSILGKSTFPFQDKGIQFLESANGTALVADEMGLGKTIQVVSYFKLHPEKLPAVIICKSIARYNWFREVFIWLDGMIPAQIIEKSSDTWFERFPIHICSYDMIRIHTAKSKDERKKEKEKKIRADVEKILDRASTIVLDECHYIKNDVSQRTVAIKSLCNGKPNVIALSGTPIKNNALEYFPVLNILRPDLFSNKQTFIDRWCDTFWSGNSYKIGGLRNLDEFRERTKSFIIRREMADVLPDLPEVRRNNNFTILEEAATKIYDGEWKEFTKYFEEHEDKKDFEFYNNILARLSKLRHITGISKIPAALDFVEEFLTETDRKLTIFVHHRKVAEVLEKSLKESFESTYKDLGMTLEAPLTLGSENKDNADKIIDEFRDNPKRRVLIASTLAAGESINLQFCCDVLLMERQWNPANEEQAAPGRFKRIGQKNSVNMTYLLAASTIDDYFTELVEQKRQIFNETMRGEKSLSQWNERGIVMELAETLARKGREKWRM